MILNEEEKIKRCKELVSLSSRLLGVRQKVMVGNWLCSELSSPRWGRAAASFLPELEHPQARRQACDYR